jgi:hypothetical protein
MLMVSAGLADSKSFDDRRKLNQLIRLTKKESDAIDARFEAHKLRFRVLNRPTTLARSGG